MYGENVIALLQEEKWKIVRAREDCTGEDNARILKRGDSPRRTANVQQQMVARGGMGRDGIVLRMSRPRRGSERREKMEKEPEKEENAGGDR